MTAAGARYALADGTRFSRTFETRMDAEAWLVAERALIDRDEWTSPQARQAAFRRARARIEASTLGPFAQRYLAQRDLRPTTLTNYRHLLRTRILPHFGDVPLHEITVTEVKAWLGRLNPDTESANAAAYRLLRTLLTSAAEEELIERVPPRVRGASVSTPKRVAKPATIEEIQAIVAAMPTNLKLFVVLAAYVGLRQGELLELRRSDLDLATGRIHVARKVDKDVIVGAKRVCPSCGRGISAPKSRSGTRTVHVPPPFWAMLAEHLDEQAAPGEDGLLFPGDRTDHMSVRYLMDRYRPARAAAGRTDLTIHHLRHTALTMAGQHGATAAELQARAGHASQAAMAIYQHATLDRDRSLAEKIGETYETWHRSRDQGPHRRAVLCWPSSGVRTHAFAAIGRRLG